MGEVVPDAPMVSKVSKKYRIKKGKGAPALQNRDVQIKHRGVNVCLCEYWRRDDWEMYALRGEPSS